MCDMPLLVLSVASFYLLGQGDWDKMQHDSGHMMLVLASQYTDGIIKSTIIFVSLRWPTWDATWLFQSFHTVGTVIDTMWCQWFCQ